MTLPANIRINTRVPFPSQVRGSGFITVVKANGIFTLTPNYTILNPAGIINAQQLIAIYDPVSQTFQSVPLSQLISSLANTRIVTAAGAVTIGANDGVILLNKTVGAPTNVNLPVAATRFGAPVTVKDYKGDSNTNNITFVPSAGETIDGFSASAAAANGDALIDINYGKKTLIPLPAGGGWYI